MRFLGLDIGTERIGVAISDETGLIAQPLLVIETGGSGWAWIEEIRDLVEEHGVGTVVVGAPLSLSGDERFTTAQAERALVGARVRRKARRAVVDKVAASLILQGYLDSLSRDE